MHIPQALPLATGPAQLLCKQHDGRAQFTRTHGLGFATTRPEPRRTERSPRNDRGGEKAGF